MRQDLNEEWLSYTTLGAHGTAIAVMMAISGGNMDDPDDPENAGYWFLPTPPEGASVDDDLDEVLGAIARLAVGYSVLAGETLYRLAAEKGLLPDDRRGDGWRGLDLARRMAWRQFAASCGTIYQAIETAHQATLWPVAIGPAPTFERRFAEDAEPRIDPLRAAALAGMRTATAEADDVVDDVDPAEDEPPAATELPTMSVATPPAPKSKRAPRPAKAKAKAN